MFDPRAQVNTRCSIREKDWTRTGTVSGLRPSQHGVSTRPIQRALAHNKYRGGATNLLCRCASAESLSPLPSSYLVSAPSCILVHIVASLAVPDSHGRGRRESARESLALRDCLQALFFQFGPEKNWLARFLVGS